MPADFIIDIIFITVLTNIPFCIWFWIGNTDWQSCAPPNFAIITGVSVYKAVTLWCSWVNVTLLTRILCESNYNAFVAWYHALCHASTIMLYRPINFFHWLLLKIRHKLDVNLPRIVRWKFEIKSDFLSRVDYRL